MIKYRPHRGGLQEAMAEAREFETEEELKEFVANHWREVPGYEKITADDVSIEPNSWGEAWDDDRIGWKDCHFVMLHGHVAGMTGK